MAREHTHRDLVSGVNDGNPGRDHPCLPHPRYAPPSPRHALSTDFENREDVRPVLAAYARRRQHDRRESSRT